MSRGNRQNQALISAPPAAPHGFLFPVGTLCARARRLGETAGEILKVSENPELIAFNKLLRWQLALRNPYLDPVNVMQVSEKAYSCCPCT